MRPNRLTMSAFGPYKEVEIIDFDTLSPHNIFVISGTTGSGKTTIFDGICYALYGNASGKDRENYRALRSDFADNDSPSTVELIFSVRGQKYRVFRQIPYLRQGNKTETPGKAELFNINDEGIETEAVDRQNIRDVNEKIEALIGFTQEQFNQLVMLPQGEFRKFLTSDTENREAILRKIFNTEIYSALVTQMKIERDKKHKALEELIYQRNQFINDIKQLPAREDIFLFSALHHDQLNIEQALKGLKEEENHYQELINTQNREISACEIQQKSVENDLQSARQQNEYFAELEKQQAALHEIEKEKPSIALARQELKLGRQASPLIAQADQIERLRNQAKTLLQHKNESAQTYEQALKQLKKTKTTFTEEQAKKPEREQLQQSTYMLESQQENLNQLQTKQRAIDTIRNQEKTEKKTLTSLRETLDILMQSIETAEKKERELSQQVEAERSLIETIHTTKNGIELRQKESHWQDKITELTNERIETSQQVKRKDEAYQAMRQQWLTNQAEQLANTLKAGEPCPVCGSKVHKKVQPDLFTAHTNSITETEYQLVERRYQEENQKLQSITLALEHAKTEAATIDTACKTQNITKTLTQLQQMLTDLEKTEESIGKARKKQKEIQAELVKNRLNLSEKNREYDVLNKSYQTTLIKLRQAEAELETILKTIPENLRDPEVFKATLAQQKERFSTLESAFNTAQNNLHNAEKKESAVKAELTAITKQYNDCVIEGKTVKAKFDEEIILRGFSDESAFIRARRSEEALQSLGSTIQQFEERYLFASRRIDELRSLTKDKEKIELPPLEEALNMMINKAKELQHQLFELTATQKKIITITNNIRANQSALQNSEKEFGRIENLYNVIRGENPLRLSFERYIQIEYLERVIEAANLRLLEMSNGQFEFVRSDNLAGHRRQSGLDLDVYDAYTGQTRDVKTMSGGEKFKASLCLSLGMADVIQSFKGGISIDTLFIDEGFGSLDEESLQQAIDVLIDLQKSGRMIGVISHVEELKQVFPARIEVTKTKSGYSQTAIVVD